MNDILKNWKTTISGVLVVGVGITMICIGYPQIGIPLIPVGVGLIVAKDS